MTKARKNCRPGTMYQYKAFATTISHAANAGTDDPLTTSRPTVRAGYLPPASTAASMGCELDMFLEMAAALSPTKPKSCGSALCASRTLVAQHATS